MPDLTATTLLYHSPQAPVQGPDTGTDLAVAKPVCRWYNSTVAMDEIKRKLALIDSQLAGSRLHARLAATAPLFFPAMGLIGGIVLAQATVPDHESLPIWSALLGLCIAATVGYALVAGRKTHPHVLAYAAGLCFLCVGALRLTAFTRPAPNDIRRLVGSQQCLATLRGRILTSPHQQRQDWCFAQFTFSDPSTTFYLAVEQAETAQGWTPVSGTIRVHVDGPTLNLRAGDAIELACWLYRFSGPTNPGQFDVARYLARRNIHVGAAVPSRDAVIRSDTNRPGIISRVRGGFADATSQALLTGMPSDTPAEGLLQALLLGNRQDIDRDTYEAFHKTGLLHFVSLSGLHLGIFVGTIWWLGRLAALAKPYRALVCMIATAAFLLVVPPRAPTVRAAVIVWVYCLALLLRRRTNPFNSLCLAAIILLMIRPTQLFEAGWQLSFTAVVGILVFTDRMQSFVPEKSPAWLSRRTERAKRFHRLFGKTGVLFSTGIAAWIGGAGILLYHFYTITPLTALWTVLVFPLVGLILVAGFVKILLFFFLPTLSGLLGLVASFGADVLIYIVKAIANLDINTILIGHVALWVVIAYYGLVLVATFFNTRHVVLKRWLCVAGAVLLVGYLGALKWQRTHRDHLDLTALDVGHGQAIVARLPGTRTVVFDAGSLYTPDVGARIVVPFLDYMGIDRLDAIFISHNDIDHINGIPEIVAARRVDHVYANDAFLAHSADQPTAQLLMQCLGEAGLRIERVPGVFDAGGATATVIWPVAEALCPADLSDNDRSLVTLIEFAGTRALLCSDIEQFAQQQIAALHPQMHADVVVCPHHGSPTTLDKEFIEGLNADALICSGSLSDYERSRGTLEALAATYLHTGEKGAIGLYMGASEMVNGGGFVFSYEGE